MNVTFPGPVGRLEGLLELPESSEPSKEPSDGGGSPRAGGPGAGGAPARLRGAAVVCHPHPLYGGTMRNTVVHRVARALRAAGLATLRFNFRGVEGSEGEHDGRGGEVLDAAAALDRVAEEVETDELWAAGFSFGARTAVALAAREARVRRVAGVALPVRILDCPGLAELDRPALLLFGERDEFGNLADLRERFGELDPAVELEEIAGADHFFRGRTPRVEERVRAFAERALAGGPPAPGRGSGRS